MLYKKQVSAGPYAKKGVDYKNGDILVILNEGKETEGQYGIQNAFLMKLINGEEKNINLNQTSINNLIDLYGEDSKNWVGKQVKVFLVNQIVQGKPSKVLYLHHPQAEMVDTPTGFEFSVPGKKPAGYPTDQIDPEEIPF